MTVFRVDGRPIVQALSDGGVAIWVGEADDPHGLAFNPAPAFEVAGDLLRLLRGEAAKQPSVVGVVEHVSVLPPAAPGLSGRVTFDVSGQVVELALPWEGLAQLAEAANLALAAAQTAGSG